MKDIQIHVERLTPGDVLDDGRKVQHVAVRGTFVMVTTNDLQRPLFLGRGELVTLREMVTD